MKLFDYLKVAGRAVKNFYVHGWMRMDDDDVLQPTPRQEPSDLELLGIGAPSPEDFREMYEVPLMKEDIGRYLGTLDSDTLVELLKIQKEKRNGQL